MGHFLPLLAGEAWHETRFGGVCPRVSIFVLRQERQEQEQQLVGQEGQGVWILLARSLLDHKHDA